MIPLDCHIIELTSRDRHRPAGDFLCHRDDPTNPVMGWTVDENQERVPIVGLATYDAALIDPESMVQLTLQGRERYPLVATADTEIATVEGEDEVLVWRRMDELSRMSEILIPSETGHLVGKPLSVSRYKGSLVPYRVGLNKLLCVPKLRQGFYAWSAVSGIVKV